MSITFDFAYTFETDTLFWLVQCHVGDWVEVKFDYSPGICSEGGTGAVIAMSSGQLTNSYLLNDMLSSFLSQTVLL